jgi:hypothetical protein
MQEKLSRIPVNMCAVTGYAVTGYRPDHGDHDNGGHHATGSSKAEEGQGEAALIPFPGLKRVNLTK